jgi:hypothetical protein
MDIGMAVGAPTLSANAWQLLRETLVLQIGQYKSLQRQDLPVMDRTWLESQLALLSAALTEAEQH